MLSAYNGELVSILIHFPASPLVGSRIEDVEAAKLVQVIEKH
jgi:hypothetical protein